MGNLYVGTPGEAAYGGTTALFCDFNTPTSGDAYATILSGTTNVTVYSNATFRVSNHNTGSPGTVQWPKRITISGFGRNGLDGAWVITGNVGDNFVTDVTLAGDSLISINAGAANKFYTVYGPISGAGNLTVISPNSAANRHTLILTNASTFSGNTTIGGGTTLQLINGDNRLPVGTALKLGISDAPVATWNAYGRLLLGNASRAVNQTINGLTGENPDGLTRIYGGNSSNISWITVNSSASNYYAGTLGGTATTDKNVGLIFSGGGTLTLVGTNLATGGLTVNSGTLEIGDGSTDYPLASPITNNGVVVLNPGLAVTVADTLTGSGQVIKRGAGTATLSGAVSYAGSTIVEAGKLSLLTTKTGSGHIAVAPGAGLEIKRATATGNISASTSALDNAQLTFNFNNKALNATAMLNVSGQLANSGSTVFYITAPVGLGIGSYPLIKYGSLQSNDFSSFSLATPISSRVTASIQDNPANRSIDLVISALDYLDWTGANDGNWDTTTANWVLSSSGLPSTYASGDFARFTDGAPGTTTVVIGADPAPGMILVTNSAKDYTFSGPAGISGNGALIKQGSRKLTLATPNNTYTGGTIVQGGTLEVGGGAMDASLPDGIENNGALVFNVASLNSASTISGSGTLSKTGPGTLTLSGASTYTGATAVSAGALAVTSAEALGATNSGTAVALGAELRVDAAGLVIQEPLTLSGSGAGSGGALIAGSGASAWSGPIQFTGDSTLAATDAASLALAGGLNAAGRHLVFNSEGSGYYLLNSPVTASSITLTNTGGLILAAANPGLTNIQNTGPVVSGPNPPGTSGLWARHDHAFGTNLTITITNGNHIGDTGTQIGLDNNVNIPATVALNAYCPGDGLEGPGGYRCTLGVRTSTTNSWSGPITLHGADALSGISSLFMLYGGPSAALPGRLVINGDITVADGAVTLFPRGWGSGQFNGKLNLGTNLFSVSDGARWTVTSTGNTWGQAEVANAATLALGANNALCAAAPLKLEGRFELDGFNQTISGLFSDTTSGVVVNHTTNAHSTLTIQAPGNLTYGGALVLSGVVGAKQFGLDIASGGLTLTSTANSYAGPTVIRAGATLALSGVGTVQISDIDVQAGATFDVSVRDTGGWASSADQVLSGNGTIIGVITNRGILTPGSSVGTLNVTSDVYLADTARILMEVNNANATSDLLSVGGKIVYGGTLVITNVSGTPYTNNQVIKLFNATGGYSGAFANILFPGITYDASQLNINGTIKVLSAMPTTPTDITVSVSGGNMTLSWPASYTGWRLEGQTNNINTGLSSNWVTVPGSTAVNNVVIPVNPANGAVFYRLVYP